MNCSQTHCSPIKQSAVVEQGLNLHLRAKRAKQCLLWGSLNAVVLAILMMDIANKCSYADSKWYYLEYIAAAITGLSVLTYSIKYSIYLFWTIPIEGTKDQKNLLQFEDNDNSFITTSKDRKSDKADITSTGNLNATILSWHSSFNDTRSMGSGNWSFNRTTPTRLSSSPNNASHNNSLESSYVNNSALNTSNRSANGSFNSSYKTYGKDEIITEEQELERYLKEVSKQERNKTESYEVSSAFNAGSINSFWNYCNTAANLLKTQVYQLAPPTTPVSQSKQANKDEGSLNDFDGNSDVIKKISSENLSQYVANIRRWISITVLQRLEGEIKNIDNAFRNRGFSDIQIGSVGLERLKKTIENQQFVNQYVPMLPLVVPFLELSTHQEYLVQRIKELAKGTCIADYRWNSGSSYNGVHWDDHLPTDSAIIFHLLCVYLDSQLMPLPQPGGRPFFDRYVILGDKKLAKETIADVKNKNKSRCAILCTNSLKPKFNFISEQQIHNCVYDRNNLFYVIIQFLIYMKTTHDSLLEGVNLGKSGINLMCIIEN